jgi:putative tricarboxylic transport membrane protein
MKKADKIIGFIMLVFACFVIEESMRMPQEGGNFEPGIRFLPFWLGVLMAILSVLLMVSAWRRKPAGGAAKSLMPNRQALISIVLLVAGLAVYIALLETLGFLIDTLLFNTFLMAVVMRARWKMTLWVAVVSSSALYVIFRILLEVPLPTNMLGF